MADVLMSIFNVSDDSVYGGVGVRPAVLRQCDNYQSNRPKQFRPATINGIHNTAVQ